jgi:hypothetical protein
MCETPQYGAKINLFSNILIFNYFII